MPHSTPFKQSFLMYATTAAMPSIFIWIVGLHSWQIRYSSMSWSYLYSILCILPYIYSILSIFCGNLMEVTSSDISGTCNIHFTRQYNIIFILLCHTVYLRLEIVFGTGDQRNRLFPKQGSKTLFYTGFIYKPWFYRSILISGLLLMVYSYMDLDIGLRLLKFC